MLGHYREYLPSHSSESTRNTCKWATHNSWVFSAGWTQMISPNSFPYLKASNSSSVYLGIKFELLVIADRPASLRPLTTLPTSTSARSPPPSLCSSHKGQPSPVAQVSCSPCLRAFAGAVFSVPRAPFQTLTCWLYSFRAQCKCHLLREAFPVHSLQTHPAPILLLSSFPPSTYHYLKPSSYSYVTCLPSVWAVTPSVSLTAIALVRRTGLMQHGTQQY